MSRSRKPADTGMLTRRAVVSLASIAPLAACSSSDTGASNFNVSYAALADAMAMSVGLKDPPKITMEQAAAIPYATIGYRVGNSGEGMLVLASQTGPTLLWTASNRAVIVTEGGRITKTSGFPYNLAGTNFHAPDPAGDFTHPLPHMAVLRTLDFPDLQRFNVGVSSTFSTANTETIEILGQKLATRIVVEDCECPEFDWTFQNKFWLDADSSFVWRSEQYTHPKLDMLKVEIFRPAA
jgi:Group 4 capsule polysaccharide lipoprotein gfcB, YjbF